MRGLVSVVQLGPRLYRLRHVNILAGLSAVLVTVLKMYPGRGR